MKIALRKIGKLFLPLDPVSTTVFSKLQDGNYKCTVTKPRVNNEYPEEIRRLAQNSLYWVWIDDFVKTTVNELAGNDEKHWHRQFKIDYLIPIYMADLDSGYQATFTSLEEVYRECGKDTYQNLYDGVVELTSTTNATVHQFRQYLNLIERYAHVNGVVLRTDPEIYKAACSYAETKPKTKKAA